MTITKSEQYDSVFKLMFILELLKVEKAEKGRNDFIIRWEYDWAECTWCGGRGASRCSCYIDDMWESEDNLEEANKDQVESVKGGTI